MAALDDLMLRDHTVILSEEEQAMKEFLESVPQYQAAEGSREVCYWAERILHCEENPFGVVPYARIGRILGGMTGGAVQGNAKRYRDHGMEQLRRGRPPILTLEQWECVYNKICEQFESHNPWTAADICEFVRERFAIPVIPNTFHHIAARDQRLRSAEADPMENTRMQVPDSAIFDHFVNLAHAIEGVPAHFVFNMDEMGHQAWADAHSKVVFVPHDAPEQVYYPVPRSGKRITLIACIAADGSIVRPCVVIPRKTYSDGYPD
jgi:hypothetical protein